MAHIAERSASRRRSRLAALAALGTRPSGRRHPLVALAIVLPLAVVFAIVFGELEAVVAQASSVAGMLGH